MLKSKEENDKIKPGPVPTAEEIHERVLAINTGYYKEYVDIASDAIRLFNAFVDRLDKLKNTFVTEKVDKIKGTTSELEMLKGVYDMCHKRTIDKMQEHASIIKSTLDEININSIREYCNEKL